MLGFPEYGNNCSISNPNLLNKVFLYSSGLNEFKNILPESSFFGTEIAIIEQPD